jgi:N-acetylglutamate synthase-like GNAT family acetyltransferase
MLGEFEYPRMAHVSSTGPTSLGERLTLRPIAVDDFSNLRYLHATSLRAQTLDVLSEEEVEAFVKLVYSPEYATLLMKEEVYGAWLDGELIGTVSWHAAGNGGSTASIGGIFVRHPRLGIGRRLLAEAEARAHQCGFERLSACATANAVPFFLRFGYEKVSRGVRSLSFGCVLPVTFVRKHLPPGRPAAASLN